MTLICVHASQSGRVRPGFLVPLTWNAPPPLFSAHLSVHVINSHWVMDDLRMQEWGGILPERPILICFLHFSLYLCLDALRAASAL